MADKEADEQAEVGGGGDGGNASSEGQAVQEAEVEGERWGGRISSEGGGAGEVAETGEVGGSGSQLLGGWPRVDDTRGMVLFVMDYQTVNMDCREGVRKVS